ncbi:MAG: type II secretion system F family protein [Halobacteria archaeon]|nr:type II secretion system F family protein [Halobacteria archaeon]
MGVPYDVYLARLTVLSVGMGLLGAVFGSVLSLSLARLGVLQSLSLNITLPPGVASFINAYDVYLQGLVITATTTLVGILGTAGGLYYLPKYRARKRGIEIDITLPHAIVFMYALSHGGTSVVNAMKELSEADDAYGEVAKEFDMVVRETEEFGSNLTTAVQNVNSITPSDNMRTFLDDLVGVMEAGGNMTEFLRGSSERYLRRAEDEQEDFLETLSVISEIYATVFIAAPLLFIIILLVLSLIGGSTLRVVFAMVYIGIPIGVVMFAVLLDMLNVTFEGSTQLKLSEDEVEVPESLKGDPRYKKYSRRKSANSLKEFLILMDIST